MIRLAILATVAAVTAALSGCGGTGGSTTAGGPGGAGEPAQPVLVEAEQMQASNVVVREYPNASGRKAVVFNKHDSRLVGVTRLPAGSYYVIVVGMAASGSSDAMELAVSGASPEVGVASTQQRISFDEKFNQFVPIANPPRVTLAKTGEVKVTLLLDDEMGAAVDYVRFVPAAGGRGN